MSPAPVQPLPPGGGAWRWRRVMPAAALAAAWVAGCASAATPVATPPASVQQALSRCPDHDLRPTPANAPQVRRVVLCLLNEERRRRGLGALVEDPALQAAAEAHSSDMAARDYFEHDSPEGIKPWMRIARTGYRASLVGENLAWGEAEKRTPAFALASWMASPGHRDNLLEPRYTQVGIGLAYDAPDPQSRRPATVYTTTFGSAAVSTR